MSFSKVEGGKIIASGIEKGDIYEGKKFGALDPDSVYAGFGLLPEVGDPPDFNPAIQECSGPTFVLDGERVNRVWVVKPRAVAEIAAEQKIKDREESFKADPLAIQLKTSTDTDAFLDACDEATILKVVKLLVKQIF